MVKRKNQSLQRKGSRSGKSKTKTDAKVKYSATKNCLSCQFYNSCNDMKKHWRYVCDRFKEIPKLKVSPIDQGKEIVEKARENPSKKSKKKKSEPQKIEAAGMKELEGEIKELKKPSIMKRKFSEKDMQDPEGFNFIHDAMLTIEKFNSSPLPANYEIDDSDAPLAKNIFEFTTDPAFLNFPSYSKQLQFGTELFADMCVRCSNPKWIERGWPLKGVKFGEDADQPPNFERIRKNIVFFEYGVCKKCGLTRKQSFKKGYLNPYMEAAGVVGQRCVTGDTIVATDYGACQISDLHTQNIEGFYPYDGPKLLIETGEYVTPSLFYFKRGEEVHEVYHDKGHSIKGTPEHPLKVRDKGFVKIKDLSVGDVLEGYNADTEETYYSLIYKIDRDLERQDVYDFHIPKYHRFIGNGIINHNSGKSEISRQWLLYTLHRFLKLQKPGLVFGLGETSKLTFTVMAQTFAKAKRDLYDPLYATLTNSPWFKTYHEILTYYGEKTGIELFRVKDTFTAYRLSNIDLQPETPDTRNLRGATRAGAIMDELDWIDSSPDGAKPKSGGVRSNVEEIYTSVSRSFATIRTAYESRLARGKASVDVNMLPPPMMICVSSPASTKSIMMKNLALSEQSRALYGFQAATWEVNPFMPRHCETIELEFKRNFDRAMRDYGAQPPHSSNPFIRDLDAMAAVISDYPNLIRTKPKYIEANNGDIMLSAKMKFTTPKDNINRIAAIDAGFSNNSFCIATGFYDEEEHEIICDALVEIIPEPDRKINFNAVCANVLIPIIERMNVTYLVADRWQSKKLLSDIEEVCDIYTQEYSLKYKDMAAVRIDVYDGHFLLPKPEVKPSKIEDLAMDDYPFSFQGKPVSHLLYQFITVRDFEKEVVKGIGLTDDVFRAFCLLHKFIADPEYRDFCSGIRMGETRQITPVLGVVGSRGQGPNGKPNGGGGGGNTGLITAQDGAPIGISVSRK